MNVAFPLLNSGIANIPCHNSIVVVAIYIPVLRLKGNLAHNFMVLYFLCLSFHLNISSMLKTKYIGNTG